MRTLPDLIAHPADTDFGGQAGQHHPPATLLRCVAGLAVIAGGLVHIQLYFAGYRFIPNPNLGRSFLLNGVGSLTLGVAVVLRRDLICRAAAFGLVASTLAAFTASRSGRGIFGFSEHGLTPSPQAIITLLIEIAGLMLLVATLLPRIGAGANLQPRLGAVVMVPTLALWAVLVALWANGSSSATPAAVTPLGPSAVTIESFAFGPDELTVPAGTTVTWTNVDPFSHSVVARNGEFGSEPLTTGASFAFTFATPGSYPFICGIHPSMAGAVVVTP